uniref:Methylosome protein 50 n=1 Tax=Timema douglasi TaxID=61478 RepID=A0A7R8VJU6_TIMDO|nr:unnamed protein product [Timema douglasi]
MEPNRNAEAYRNYVPPDLPALVENYIDFIEFCADGYMLLGSSNLTGRHWCGSLWYFIDPDGAPDVEKCLTGMTCENGILIGEDSGTLQVLALSESPEEHTFHFSTVATACGHDDSVLSVDVFAGEKRAVTGSADMNIKVWNTEALECEHTYRTAHTHHVTSVSAHPQENNSVFASCSLDGTVYMWDTRQTKPASVVMSSINPQSSPSFTSVSWQPSKSGVLAIGSSIGTVTLTDTRLLKPFIQFNQFDRSIYRLRFAGHNPDLLAVCADNTQVKIFNCENGRLIYSDDRHEDFVRGLAWNPKTEQLYSCGWDKKVLVHSPSPNMNTNALLASSAKGDDFKNETTEGILS